MGVCRCSAFHVEPVCLDGRNSMQKCLLLLVCMSGHGEVGPGLADCRFGTIDTRFNMGFVVLQTGCAAIIETNVLSDYAADEEPMYVRHIAMAVGQCDRQ